MNYKFALKVLHSDTKQAVQSTVIKKRDVYTLIARSKLHMCVFCI